MHGRAGQAEAAEEQGLEARRAEVAQQAQRGAVLAAACAQQQQRAGEQAGSNNGGARAGGGASRRLFGIVGDGQSHWQPLVREAKGVMELAGLDTDWLLRDLLVYADAVYA